MLALDGLSADLVVCHPQTKRVAMSTMHGEVRVWMGTEKPWMKLAWKFTSGSTGSLRQILHRGQVQQMAFSQDGKKLATVGDDCAWTLWDLEENLLLLRQYTLYTSLHPHNTLAYSKNDDAIVIGSSNRVTSFSTTTGNSTWNHNIAPDESIRALVLSSDARHVAVATNTCFRLLSMEIGQLLRTRKWDTPLPMRPSFVFAMSPDCSKIAISSSLDDLVLYRFDGSVTAGKTVYIGRKLEHALFLSEDSISLRRHGSVATLNLQSLENSCIYVSAVGEQLLTQSMHPDGSLWIILHNRGQRQDEDCLQVRCIIDTFDVDAAFGDMKNAGKTS